MPRGLRRVRSLKASDSTTNTSPHRISQRLQKAREPTRHRTNGTPPPPNGRHPPKNGTTPPTNRYENPKTTTTVTKPDKHLTAI